MIKLVRVKIGNRNQFNFGRDGTCPKHGTTDLMSILASGHHVTYIWLRTFVN